MHAYVSFFLFLIVSTLNIVVWQFKPLETTNKSTLIIITKGAIEIIAKRVRKFFLIFSIFHKLLVQFGLPLKLYFLYCELKDYVKET